MASVPSTDHKNRKRRNASLTKLRIVAAAQRNFAAHGYAKTGLREIASEAGVALSLIPQHFGSKADLFEAALIAAMKGFTILELPRDRWGCAMIDYMCSGGDVSLPAMVILSTGDVEAREIAARIIREQVLGNLADRLGRRDAPARAMQVTMLATGFLLYARQLPIGSVDDATKRRFATMLQKIIDDIKEE